ncbi:uncharacterized protein LOC115963844 [Quercus lobata]|uniref:uncharacterized protein LOC115963844 n=1 Tax=Quercus lobata TaxID=97700 RepID=UPI0012464A44|nr:uncharacterized protein LOC115963844 [Quercus lobata]
MTDLKTAIETARDLTQMRVQVSMVGTQFGVAPPGIPMPSNISLVNDGWSCPMSSSTGNQLRVVVSVLSKWVCLWLWNYICSRERLLAVSPKLTSLPGLLGFCYQSRKQPCLLGSLQVKRGVKPLLGLASYCLKKFGFYWWCFCFCDSLPITF